MLQISFNGAHFISLPTLRRRCRNGRRGAVATRRVNGCDTVVLECTAMCNLEGEAVENGVIYSHSQNPSDASETLHLACVKSSATTTTTTTPSRRTERHTPSSHVPLFKKITRRGTGNLNMKEKTKLSRAGSSAEDYSFHQRDEGRLKSSKDGQSRSLNEVKVVLSLIHI